MGPSNDEPHGGVQRHLILVSKCPDSLLGLSGPQGISGVCISPGSFCASPADLHTVYHFDFLFQVCAWIDGLKNTIVQSCIGPYPCQAAFKQQRSWFIFTSSQSAQFPIVFCSAPCCLI